MDPKEQYTHTPQSVPPHTDSFTIPHDTTDTQNILTHAVSSEKKVEGVRTFQSDITDSIKSDNVNMIKIALAEKERQEQEGTYFDLESTKKKYTPTIAIIASVLVFIFGVVGALYWYFNAPPTISLEEKIAPSEPTLLYSEIQSLVSITGKQSDIVLADLKKETLANLDLGIIKRILVTDGFGTSTKNITSQEFLRLIGSRAPESFHRSIEPYFFIGAYSFTPHDVCMIFKINSYDTAYPAMLEWEKTLESDIGPLFIAEQNKTPVPTPEPVLESGENPDIDLTPSDISPETELPQNELASNTSSTTLSISPTSSSALPQPIIKTTADSSGNIFKDKIIQNKDVRALVNPKGDILFMYTFIDKKTLLIVSSEKGLKEMLTRMTTGRIRR